MGATKCRCLHKCPQPGVQSGTCHLQPGGFCFAHAEVITAVNGSIQYELTRGCFPGDIEGLLQCKGALSKHWLPKNISCCQSEDFCNDHLSPTIDARTIQDIQQNLHIEGIDAPSSVSLLSAMIFLFSALLSFTIFILIAFLLYHVNRKRLEKKRSKLEEKSSEKLEEAHNYGSSNENKLTPSRRLLELVRPPCSGLSNFWRQNGPRVGGGICTSPSDSSISSIKYSHLHSSASTASKSSTMTSNGTTSTALTSNTLSSSILLPKSVTNSNRLIQKTLLHDIIIHPEELKQLRGGSFGVVVVRGRFKETDVSVKIFPPEEASAWRQEMSIYANVVMRHENILHCLGADVLHLEHSGQQQLWLVTEYHPFGDLYDYLKRSPIQGLDQLLSLMRSVVSGLEYLHRETIGVPLGQGKAPIAHRNLQSIGSVLMRSNGTSCLIADFTRAVTKDQLRIMGKRSAKLEAVGSVRYLAPELLVSALAGGAGDSVAVSLEDYKRADIYSLGLIFWEMYHRLRLPVLNQEVLTEENDYRLPYSEFLDVEGSFGDFEEMHRLVVIEKRRPPLDAHPNEQPLGSQLTLSTVRALITECWTETPSARLTALNIKKKLMMAKEIRRLYLMKSQ